VDSPTFWQQGIDIINRFVACGLSFGIGFPLRFAFQGHLIILLGNAAFAEDGNKTANGNPEAF
jgi:hypothetical protein